ncbi:hypothetical protein [Methylobacillus glycogenes]|uniref:hypothetical protein n=1 Tax=Methylobacillus glycogenes TaxID=406 RepID=UPI000472FD13|nr:hypothetical protein [Methylobacillus glycogenes]
MRKTLFPINTNYSRSIRLDNTDIAVPQVGLTEVATMVVSGHSRVFFQVTVQNFALDQFVISARATEQAPFSPLFSQSSDYLAPDGILLGCSDDLSLLAAGKVASMLLDVRGFYEFKLEASSVNVAGSIVNIHGGGA